MEQKGIGLTILGVVAIIAIVGLVLLFTGGATGKAAYKGLPGGVASSKDVCSGILDCNGPLQATWSGFTFMSGQRYHVCRCPGENSVSYVLATQG